jgi:hypothetical protein
MKQDGTVVAIRRVTINGNPLGVSLNGIAASDATTPMIFTTFGDPNTGQGGVLALPAF